MIRGIYQNSSSMLLLESKVDVIANNMANVSTAGYKRKGVFFQQMIEAEQAIDRNQIKVTMPKGFTPTYTQFTDGKLLKTDNPLDIGLSGEGFFSVQTNNGTAYTRSGEFGLNSEGMLTTSDGSYVIGESGPIEIQGGLVEINSQGEIIVDGNVVNKFMLKKFPLEGNIKNENNLIFPPANAQIEDAEPSVMQGFVEKSNVNIVKEMVDLIQAQKHFDANQRLIKAQDATLNKVVNNVGK